MLRCARCGEEASSDVLRGPCDCGGPRLFELETGELEGTSPGNLVRGADRSVWRWRDVLPPTDDPLTLGEGGTPLLPLRRLADRLDLADVRVKEESLNPTGTFKARGLALAVTMARDRGAQGLTLGTAGNAGGAAAAYGARAGLPVRVFVPDDAPEANVREARAFGAEVVRIDGLIPACGREAAALGEQPGWVDVSTGREPYRVEGKKTMGYELLEALGGDLPDVIVYPTGGGTGLIGMAKAFGEMERLGWIGPERPRMVAVQAEGCAPIVRAFEEGDPEPEPWTDAGTVAGGLRVPSPGGGFLVLRALRETGGTAVAVSDDAIREAAVELGAAEGIHAGPEGAAPWAGLKELVARGDVEPDDRVVLFCTGTGMKELGRPGRG